MSRSPVFLAFFLAVSPASATESSIVSFPDHAAGRHARALAEAVAAGTDEALLRFVESSYAASALAERPAAARAENLKRVLHDLGRGAPALVEDLGPRSTRLTIKSAGADLWVSFTLELEPDPPHGILRMRIEAEDRPPEPAPSGGPVSEAEAIASLGRLVDERAAAGKFSGVVLVARGGEVVLARAVGVAERNFAVPITLETKFNLGSINKVFTMLVIDQLAAEGKLQVDETIARLLPDYPNAEVARRVTVARLLDHASGLGDFFGERYDATPKDRLRSLQDYLPLFVDQPLLFEPGADRRYSNAGYIVLGLIIERITGKSYYDAVRERIFEPLGMKDTASYEADEVVAGLAFGYTSRSQEGQPVEPRRNIYTLPARGSSAGGGYSTAGDLLRFTTGVREGRLGAAERWRRQGGMAIAGGSPGVNGIVEDDWETGWTLIVLANVDPPAAEGISRAARSILARVRG